MLVHWATPKIPQRNFWTTTAPYLPSTVPLLRSRATQADLVKKLAMVGWAPTRTASSGRSWPVQGEITKRGVIDALRKGVHTAPRTASITRQLRYSTDETRRALDLCLFINGLPIATFELKNSLTKQTVEDAVEQYKRDRDPRERLFEFGRCVVHFAVDDQRGADVHRS